MNFALSLVRFESELFRAGKVNYFLSHSGIGYITFVLFPRHTAVQARDNTINLIHMFRLAFTENLFSRLRSSSQSRDLHLMVD